MLIYLDVCCLNRPFDNQEQERIHLEAEAVLLILSRCQSGEWVLLGSEAIDAEIAKTPDTERKDKAMLLNSLATTKVEIDPKIESRAREFIKFSGAN